MEEILYIVTMEFNSTVELTFLQSQKQYFQQMMPCSKAYIWL